MKKAAKILGLLSLGLILSLASCEKYENGGSKRKAEKNLTANTWKLSAYFLDDVDNTSSLLISNYTEKYNSDGSYLRNYTDASGDLKSEPGTWTFDSDKSLLNISGIGSFELTAETSTVSASDYTLVKLTKDELWYYFENGGSTHEFHLVPN